MLNNFETPNSSLTEQVHEEAKTTFEQAQRGIRLRSFQKLTQMLHEMKIPIPESMMIQINRCLSAYPIPKFSFNAFTHFVARSTLEQELQEEIRNLFFQIDRRKTGKVDAEDLTALFNDLNGAERIDNEGVNELLSEMDFLNVGYLNYEDFVYLLLPK